MIKSLEITAWTLAALLVAAAALLYRPFPLDDDGIVYLDVAANLRAGNGIATSIAHYDTERSHGRLPAPMTTFPPGYPAAISLFGGSETAARAVSIAPFAATAALLVWAMRLAGIPGFTRAMALLLLLTNMTMQRYNSGVQSESLFTLFAFVALLGILFAERTSKHGPVAAVLLSCGAIGLAYTVRYAGLFLIPPVAAYALYRFWISRQWPFALAPLIPVSIAGAFMVRNTLLVGDWRGGNDLPILNPWGALAGRYVRGQLHLLLGNHRIAVDVWEVRLAIAAILIAAALLFATKPWQGATRGPLLVTLWILTYTAAFFYAARHSVVDLDSRMFVPMLPCYLLLFGMIFGRIPGSLFSYGSMAILVISYSVINFQDFDDTPYPRPRHQVVAGLLAQATDGRSMRAWLDSNVAPDEVIAAVDGQAVGYLVKRPTLSLVPPVYSPVRWECEDILREMARFKARYLIVFKSFPAGSPENESSYPPESKFIAGSVQEQLACGFTIAAENKGVRILKTR